MSHSFARAVESEGVTVAEWVFLRVLYDEDHVSPSQLAERMGMTKGAISKLAERLADKSLIERQANVQDSRGQTLALTPTARKLVPRLSKIADRNDADFFDCLTANEKHQLDRLLRKVAQNKALTRHPTE
ncbi:MAG TPA: MarR family transcriptional regulator [Polyangiales bacterium]|nr:MarR family transcriptional regulator [Polyangiales bacterium]